MNKEDLVRVVATEVDLSPNAVRSVLDGTLKTIASALESQKQVMLIGFGTFGAVKRKARMVNHPQTGVPMRIDARVVPFFRPGKELRRRVAGKRRRGRPRKK